MNWSVIGINYQKANLEQRQKFALDEDHIQETYEYFLASGITNALIVSTCNRTEFFIPQDANAKALEILSKHIYKDYYDEQLFHFKSDAQAIHYFFRICSGLESQIAGDFEILGQVRKACGIAKANGMITGTWERIINNALSSAKKARTTTGFYSGASSTSYACIEHIKTTSLDLKTAKYLILGAGKIGSHTIDHLLKFAPSKNITITNRSFDKSLALANKKDLKLMPFKHLSMEAEHYDVIICATNASEYILTEKIFKSNKRHHIVDLSVPMNVDPSLGKLENIELINVDQLSDKVNANMRKRVAERRNVERIIAESILDLNAWFTIKSGMPMLSELKKELQQIKQDALSNVIAEDKTHSAAFLDEYTDHLFNHLSQQWIKKVRNKTLDAH
ncbi:glutamyl-tRNA reductase [Portibacter lacus]|uniref:Glutamyl-tRNA reductase n=1 Tax=Portibacter lacus TaxID=1099794 RepID=A0AA37SWV9_9BACT|nr:glutamyl-tRNA reductase [Portibacter lacus]GLR19115.1 glutamyl-tRNA reductase [Portibacter lacus]